VQYHNRQKKLSEFRKQRPVNTNFQWVRAKKIVLYWLVATLIILIKFFGFLQRIFSIFFVNFIWKPLRWLLRFIFYKIIVKTYARINTVLRRLGWSQKRGSAVNFLLNQKLVHIIVIFLTIIFVFLNLTSKTKAGALNDVAGQTVIASLIQSEFGSLEEQQLVEEFFDYDQVITPTQQAYLDNLDAFKAEQGIDQDDRDDEPLFSDDSYQKEDAVVISGSIETQIAKRLREENVFYIVQPGDTVSTIARQFDITVSTILWENNLSAYSLIRPGDKLTILPVSGITHNVKSGETLSSIAKKYSIPSEEIVKINKLAISSDIKISDRLLIPGGTKEYVAPKLAVSYNGIDALKNIIKPRTNGSLTNKMAWPTVGARITQYYSWRHKGLDVANKTGTPIYAADSGKIEVAGWGTGYGNQIVINHGGGKKTRYAHLSQFLVKKGDVIDKGEIIGRMGSTGWSTGPHLHFEIIINGVKYNPLNYIK
jgi:murein DD-endopeptidase MepM/ murein hydrolase activator NlpD